MVVSYVVKVLKTVECCSDSVVQNVKHRAT